MKIVERIKAKLFALIFWQTSLGEFFNKAYDLKIFYSNSFTKEKLKNQENYLAYLTKQYHIIEKGLALPYPKKGFGKAKIMDLINKAESYLGQYGDHRVVDNIRAALIQYMQRNPQLIETDTIFYGLINRFSKGKKSTGGIGGVKKIERSEIEQAIDIDFERFVKSRSSVRNFSAEEIHDDDIYKAVNLARNTPSVCNRQSWRVHIYKDSETKLRLLQLQNGNNGFTTSINRLLIITTDTRKFTNLESNQVFVDGGLFAMNLLLSLHAHGIASCCLNTCLPYTIENRIKAIGKISKSERLIMMIGIGKFKDTFEVATSEKKPIESIIDFEV